MNVAEFHTEIVNELHYGYQDQAYDAKVHYWVCACGWKTQQSYKEDTMALLHHRVAHLEGKYK